MPQGTVGCNFKVKSLWVTLFRTVKTACSRANESLP